MFGKEERSLLLSGSSEAKERLLQLNQDGARLDFVEKLDIFNKSKSLKEIAASLKQKQTNMDKALEHRDRLLDFDQKSVARSKVFDDQTDYFTIQTQNFITDENRAKINQKVDYIVENKFNKVDKIQIDFDSMSVTEKSESVIQDLEAEHRMLEQLSVVKSDYELVASSNFIDEDNSDLKRNLPPPVYVPSEMGRKFSQPKSGLNRINTMENYSQRVQDRDLEILDDKGMCLAMRQPYASLLVAGVKKFEGRTWFSPFKGRLWIYAAQKSPTVEDIKTVEEFYSKLATMTAFPKQYPTGAIVGCVTVEDCLPIELCLQQYPHCEIESPYAFVCDYPIQFMKPFPVIKGGGQQIYKLEPIVHQACKKMLGF